MKCLRSEVIDSWMERRKTAAGRGSRCTWSSALTWDTLHMTRGLLCSPSSSGKPIGRSRRGPGYPRWLQPCSRSGVRVVANNFQITSSSTCLAAALRAGSALSERVQEQTSSSGPGSQSAQHTNCIRRMDIDSGRWFWMHLKPHCFHPVDFSLKSTENDMK